jgi:hypothetical protein
MEFRWYGKKIYHMLMPFDELDSLMKHYLNPNAYSNMCEILDSIRAKVRIFFMMKKKGFFLLGSIRVELVRPRVILQKIMDDVHYHRRKWVQPGK